MMRKAQDTGNFKRVAIISVLVGVGLFIGWALWATFMGNGLPGFTVCDIPRKDYRVAKIYQGDGSLEMIVYAFSYADQTSEELMLAAGKQGATPGALYHQFYTKELCNSTKCSGLALDIGAYLGTHGLYLAKMGLEVHSFEPYKISTNLLRCSATANKFKKLFVVSEGVSDENGVECLLKPVSNTNHLAMFAPKGVGSCSKEAGNAFDVVTLDHYWTNVLQNRPIKFIKIDTEAHELYVLKGGAKLFTEAPPPMVLMEFYPRLMKLKSVAVNDLMTTVYNYGYRVYDCQAQEEVPKGASGLKQLAKYDTQEGDVTDLLLLHSSVYKGTLKQYRCGY